MADKIKVTICSGTACYVMGASDLLLLEENLPASLIGRVEIEGETCLGYCKDSKNGRAPYVLVNGELMAGATVVSIIAKVQELADA